MQNTLQKDQKFFQSSILALQAETINIGAHFVVDAEARRTYSKEVSAMSSKLSLDVSKGKITWLMAASQAQELRNHIMEIARSRSTPVGLAIAQQLKSKGKTLNQLVARKSQKIYGNNINFSSLSKAQQNNVYSEIVKSAGKSNPKVTEMMTKLSYAGRGLIFTSIALSIYTVSTAKNKFDAAGKEIFVSGASIGGGIAGGAAAGLLCGPGAPVCATVGAFAGGALAAFGVDMFW